MKERTSTLGEVGDLSAPPGSRPWAVALKQMIRAHYRDRESALENLGVEVSLFLRHEGWKALEDRNGRPFGSWEAFCRCPPPFGLGVDPEAVTVEVERRAKLRDGPGRPKKGEENERNTLIAAPHSDTVERVMLRLDRDAPALAEAVRAGDLSANAAAIQAGFRARTITVPLDPSRAARILAKHFDRAQLDELVALLGDAA